MNVLLYIAIYTAVAGMGYVAIMIASVICYYTDPTYRAQYGRPVLWPWGK